MADLETVHATIDHTGITGAGAAADILDLPTVETDDTLVLAPDGAGGVEFRAETGGGGGSLTTVTAALTADRSIAGDSAYHDITDLTGMVLAAGTWMGFINVAVMSGGNAAVNIRVVDGSAVQYAEQEFVYINVFSIAASFAFHIPPFVLGGSATLKLQGFSGAAFTVKKVADQGTTPTKVMTNVTFLKIA